MFRNDIFVDNQLSRRENDSGNVGVSKGMTSFSGIDAEIWELRIEIVEDELL